MRHNDSQGFPDPWDSMTSEDWSEMDKYAEEAHKKMMKDNKSEVNLLDKKTWKRKPPF